MKNANDVINAMVKTIGGLSGLIFLLFVISQFLAYFYFTNMATVIAVKMADALQNANLDALWLLIDFVSWWPSSTSSSRTPSPSGRSSPPSSCRS